MFAFLKKMACMFQRSFIHQIQQVLSQAPEGGRLVKQTLLPLHCSRNKADPLHGMRLQRCCSIFTVRECRNRSLGN